MEHRLRPARENVEARLDPLGDEDGINHHLGAGQKRGRLGVLRVSETEDDRRRSSELLGEIRQRRDADPAADEQRPLDAEPITVPERPEHAGAAALLPGAEVVVDPVLVTELIEPGFDVLACGPEPMLHAVASLSPTAQLAWEAPMACGYGACYGCVVEIDGALERLCLEGPVLDAVRVRAHVEAVA